MILQAMKITHNKSANIYTINDCTADTPLKSRRRNSRLVTQEINSHRQRVYVFSAGNLSRTGKQYQLQWNQNI